MAEELKLGGLMVAPEVVETIVRLAAEKVEGVACVGVPTDLNSMFSFFSSKRPQPVAAPVSVEADGDALRVGLHLTVLFGYPFKTLADEVRQAVSSNLASQVGTDISGVDVHIDALVFPKE